MRKARLPNFLKTAVELPGGTFPTHQGLLMDAYESHWVMSANQVELREKGQIDVNDNTFNRFPKGSYLRTNS